MLRRMPGKVICLRNYSGAASKTTPPQVYSKIKKELEGECSLPENATADHIQSIRLAKQYHATQIENSFKNISKTDQSSEEFLVPSKKPFMQRLIEDGGDKAFNLFLTY